LIDDGNTLDAGLAMKPKLVVRWNKLRVTSWKICW
jgi:hypothetical protein